MPPNTVSVTRPGKWGNPYVVGDNSQDTFVPVLMIPQRPLNGSGKTSIGS